MAGEQKWRNKERRNNERVVKSVLTELCSRVDKLVKFTKRQQVLETKKQVCYAFMYLSFSIR